MALILDANSRTDKRTGTTHALESLGIGGSTNELGTGTYGDAVAKIFVVFNCTPDSVLWKDTSSLDRKTKVLYVDVMLDYERMVKESHRGRMAHILKRLEETVPATLDRLIVQNFDISRATLAFLDWLDSLRPRLEAPIPEFRATACEEDQLTSKVEESVPIQFVISEHGQATSLAAVGALLQSLSLDEQKCFPRAEYGPKANADGSHPLVMILVAVHCDSIPWKPINRFKTSRILTVHMVVDTTTIGHVSESETQSLFLTNFEAALVKSFKSLKIARFDKDRFLADVHAWLDEIRSQLA